MTGRTRTFMMAFLVVTFGAGTVGASSSANDRGRPTGASSGGDDVVVVEDFDSRGAVISIQVLDELGRVAPMPPDVRLGKPDGRGGFLGLGGSGSTGPQALAMPQGSGSGGTSSASGCRKVTVSNENENWSGGTLYWFHTWTYWCWNRTNKTTSSVSTGWSLSSVDSLQEWQGVINDQRYFYSWLSGATKSGYYHYKMGHFKNCFLGVCGANTYPQNYLWSHSDGTWYWTTYD